MQRLTVSAQHLQQITGVEEFGIGLTPYLLNLSKGRPMTPHSWLYEKEDAKQIQSQWIEIMERSNAKVPFGQEFSSFDLKQVEKFGPQGGTPPITSSEVRAVIDPLYSSSTFDDENALEEWFPQAHKFGRVLFGASTLRLRPMAPESVVNDMYRRDTLSTNSGYPRFTKRKRTQKQEVQDAYSQHAYDYPAIVLLRYYYGKLRPVWMFPMSTNLIEAGFATPIQMFLADRSPEWVQRYCTPWLGFDHVKSVITKQWTDGAVMVGGDTTKMDAHMRKAQLRLVFEIVKWLFQRKYWEELKKSLMHVCEIDLLAGMTADRKIRILRGTHGLSSGSSWTQLSETVLQLFMCWCAKDTEGQGIGDDFIWVSASNKWTAETLVEWLEKFGLPANPAKQSVEEDSVTFLQRYFHRSFFSESDGTVLGAYYPTIRALGSMLWPEKFHDRKVWNAELFCLRNYTILENCVDDPCFDEFVRFVVKGHKEMSSFAKAKAANLNAVQKAARSVPGLLPNYNQEKQFQPLSAYKSIQIAKSL